MSLDSDEDDHKWKDFVAKNGMSWLQYRDGRFKGPMAQNFGVEAIPQTFTIDCDGVLQDQHIGDANIEGKLKKLLAQAGGRLCPIPVSSPRGFDNPHRRGDSASRCLSSQPGPAT
ncbi:MAG TPA: hypothetical protein VGD62_10465 [Acidobacteriaceae bacterium]